MVSAIVELYSHLKILCDNTFMTHPLKLHPKVLSTKDKFGLTFQETSKRFDISIRSLFRWQHQLEPISRRNKPATKIDMGALLQHVTDDPDASLYERAEAFNATPQAIHYELKRLDISHNKNAATS